MLNRAHTMKKDEGVGGQRELEKLSGADPLIPLQAFRNKLVQTQTLFIPAPLHISATTHFLSFLVSPSCQWSTAK